VICNPSNQTVVTYSVTAVDDCDPNPTIVCNPPSGSAFPLGTNTVNCSATDKCGNKSACSFTVTVTDLPGMTIVYQADGSVLICWPITCRNYVLYCKQSLNPTVPWTPVTGNPTIVNGRYCLKLQFVQGQHRFYRLVASTP